MRISPVSNVYSASKNVGFNGEFLCKKQSRTEKRVEYDSEVFTVTHEEKLYNYYPFADETPEQANDMIRHKRCYIEDTDPSNHLVTYTCDIDVKKCAPLEYTRSEWNKLSEEEQKGILDSLI